MMFRLRAWQVHASLMLLLSMFIVYLQAYVLGRMQSSWFHVDLATVFVVYVSIEHLLLGALIRIFVVAALMHMFSGAPDGFYLMFFMLALVISNILARFFALHKLNSQFLIFAGIFCLKFVLVYGSLSRVQRVPDGWAFLSRVAPSLIMTTLLSVPLFALFATIDSLFDASARRDHRQELVEN
jgi:hypothetical protein